MQSTNSAIAAPSFPLPSGQPALAMTAETVMARLEEAGRTLLALPNTGPSTRLVQSGMEWVRDAAQASVPPDRARLRPAVPPASDITRMDEALAWIPLIPVDRYVLRRIVGARCLVSPMTGRYLYTWRRLGIALGADHKAVQRWHAQGIERIVAALQPRAAAATASDTDGRPGRPQPSGHHRRPQA